MSIGAPAQRKIRKLADALAVAAASTGYPAFSGGGIAGSPVVFAGDMAGCHIHSVEVTVASLTGITGITPTFETSHDGITWVDWFAALTEITANGTVIKKAEDDFEAPRRFIRVKWSIAGAGTLTLTINVSYDQVGPRGAYAPPGTRDRY